MMKITSEIDKVCVAKAKEAGQGHLFESWDQLDTEARRALMADLEATNLQLVQRLVHRHLYRTAPTGGDLSSDRLVLSPVDAEPVPDDPETRETGVEALESGRVALVLLAGGEGVGPRREPTGFLPVGPLSGKSLFQLHAERVRALRLRCKASIPWWIVTHPETHDRVVEFFRENSYFGLSASSIRFLEQPLLPLVDRRGKFVQQAPGRLDLRASGHGGVLHTLLDPTQLAELDAAGIEHVFFFQVDNALVPVADAGFVGAHIRSGAEASSKCVERTDPAEELGVFCSRGDASGVVEYSEIADEERERRDATGRLTFRCGNIAVHIFRTAFLRRLIEQSVELPFHAVERTVECVGRRGQKVRPLQPNCIEFRSFLFDALWLARSHRLFVVDRDSELSRVKNTGGPCSPQTAQRDLARLHARWLRAAGAELPAEDSAAAVVVEISPLFALDESQLRERLESPGPIETDRYFSGS